MMMGEKWSGSAEGRGRNGNVLGNTISGSSADPESRPMLIPVGMPGTLQVFSFILHNFTFGNNHTSDKYSINLSPHYSGDISINLEDFGFSHYSRISKLR